MDNSYAPVLKMLGQRNETDPNTMVWIALILFLLPLLLLAGNYLLHHMHRRKHRVHGFNQLKKVGSAKGLTHAEQVTLENIAALTHLSNPASLLGSVEIFDRAVGVWMKHLMQQPWYEMETRLERIKSIREKLGFRYLAPERPPVSTRELKIGQKIYSLATSKTGLVLISAEIIDLDDLSIVIWPFQAAGRPIKLPKNHDLRSYFWSEGGGEYRFRTRLIKEVIHPVHYLMLHHSDELYHNTANETFTRDLNLEVVLEWIPTARYGPNLSPNTFDRVEDPETLAGSMTQVSGSGFSMAVHEQLDIDDLVRLKGGENLPAFLVDSIGKVLQVTPEGIHFKFLQIDPGAHHKLLAGIAKHIAPESLVRKARTRKSSSLKQ